MSVPVLSKTMAVRPQAVSRSVMFLISTPRRAAALKAATMAAGVDRTIAEGTAIIKIVRAWLILRVKMSTMPATMMIVGVYQAA